MTKAKSYSAYDPSARQNYKFAFTPRFARSYRKVNNVTKSESYPIPRVNDCIDRIGRAKHYELQCYEIPMKIQAMNFL